MNGKCDFLRVPLNDCASESPIFHIEIENAVYSEQSIFSRNLRMEYECKPGTVWYILE